MNKQAFSEPLNKLKEIINNNSSLISKDDLQTLQDIYSELHMESVLYEEEVKLNEKMLEENENLRYKVNKIEEIMLFKI